MSQQAPTLTFQPRWKEELTCSCSEGSFILGMPMGNVSVDFPTEERWLQQAQPWAQPHWAAFLQQLQHWCSGKGIPLYVAPTAGVY
jgi:hypothetical protein